LLGIESNNSLGVSDAAVDPFNSSRILASGGSDLFRSEDAGSSWSIVNKLKMSHCIYASSETPDRFLFGDGYGIFETNDGGETLNREAPVLDISVVSLESGLVGSQRPVYAASYMSYMTTGNGGIYRSLDDGKTWQGPFLDGLDSTTLAVYPRNGRQVFIAGEQNGEPKLLRLLDSDDRLSTQTLEMQVVDITPPYDLNQGIYDIEIDPEDSSHVLISTYRAIYESFDAGENWAVLRDGFLNACALHLAKSSFTSPSPIGGSSLAQSTPSVTGRLFAGIDGGFYRFVGDDSAPAVSGIGRSGYRTGILLPGEFVYADRDYQILESIPSVVSGNRYILTLNADKNSSGTDFLRFMINRPATIFVAHDIRFLHPPAWLGSWKRWGEALSTDDIGESKRRLFSKDVPAGQVTLGGNIDAGMDTDLSMYTVIVCPLLTEPAGSDRHWTLYE